MTALATMATAGDGYDSDAALVRQFRDARIARGLSQVAAARRIGMAQPTLSDIENGKKPLSPRWRQAMRGEVSLAAEDGHLPWFEPWVAAERLASSFEGYEGQVMPGLFQTAAYARCVLVAADPLISAAEVERQVAARITRQEIWQREDPPPPLMSVIIGKMALRQMVGSAPVMAEQLGHLAAMCEHPRVRIRVLPFRAGNSVGLLPAFVIASFAPDSRPDLAYLDDALMGRTTDNRAAVKKLGLVYGLLAAEALSPGDSLTEIRKAAEEWMT